MIVDEVHVHRYTIDEAKDDTPVAGYSDTPLAAPSTRQLVQSTAREGHVMRRTSVLQRSQQATDTCHMGSVQSSGIAKFIEPPQPLVREPHGRTVTCNVARCMVKYWPAAGVCGQNPAYRNRAQPPAARWWLTHNTADGPMAVRVGGGGTYSVRSSGVMS